MTEHADMAPTGAGSVPWRADVFGAGFTVHPADLVLGRPGMGRKWPVGTADAAEDDDR